MAEQEYITLPKQESSTKQRLALYALQKQMQLLRLKEALILVGFSVGAAALRAPMQVIPSAEPITFFAILSGWLFGKYKGFMVGASAAFLSNFFVYGGQGPWTIPQMLAWGAAGFLAGFLPKFKLSKKNYLFALIPTLAIVTLSTIIFDLTLNIAWGLTFPVSMIGVLLTGIPFFVIHLISNLSFALLLPAAKKLTEKTGSFNEKEMCQKLIKQMKTSQNE